MASARRRRTPETRAALVLKPGCRSVARPRQRAFHNNSDSAVNNEEGLSARTYIKWEATYQSTAFGRLGAYRSAQPGGPPSALPHLNDDKTYAVPLCSRSPKEIDDEAYAECSAPNGGIDDPLESRL